LLAIEQEKNEMKDPRGKRKREKASIFLLTWPIQKRKREIRNEIGQLRGLNPKGHLCCQSTHERLLSNQSSIEKIG